MEFYIHHQRKRKAIEAIGAGEKELSQIQAQGKCPELSQASCQVRWVKLNAHKALLCVPLSLRSRVTKTGSEQHAKWNPW